MSFPRYENYKPSGIDCLGVVPEHWEILSLARVTIDKCDGPFGSGLKSEHYTDFGVRVIRLQNIRRDGFDDSDEAFIDPDYYSTSLNGHDVIADDILIAGLGDERNTVGRACVAPNGIEPAMVKADCFRFRLDTFNAFPKFIAYQLTSNSTVDAGLLSSGSTRSRIPLSVMASRRLVLPPFEEQTAIAEFLDRETSKIDDLIAEQKRLIELLKEKRQAVISHAVTKGLNPDAPLKDSGIEWLGEVPEHWQVWKVGRRFEIRVGKMLDSSKITGKFLKPYLRVADVQWGTIKVEDLPEMDFDDDSKKKFRLIDGDLLVNEGGSYVGRCAIWREQLEECYYQKALHRLRPLDKSRDSTDFFFYVMLYATQLGVFVAGGNQNTIDHLPAEALRQYKFAFPPLDEQIDLANQIADLTHDLENLCTQAEQAIELLQERRTALISAAITGKIDVREFAYQEVTAEVVL